MSRQAYKKVIPEKMIRRIIQPGDVGLAVRYLQFNLKITESGNFDDVTESEVRSFQKSAGLVSDGVVGPKTWSALLDLPHLRDEEKVKQSKLNLLIDPWDSSTLAKTWIKYGALLLTVSQRLGLKPATLLAVLMVESNGQPFGPDGRPIIRFENHKFYDFWGKYNSQEYSKYFMFATEEGDSRWENHFYFSPADNTWVKLHVGSTGIAQKNEWNAFTIAKGLDSEAAIKSTSFGLSQVIGFNAEQSGYTDLEQFVDDMNDEKLQILAMIEFIRNGKKMLDSLWALDFVSFAREYNGVGQPDIYGEKIKTYYEEASKYI